MESHRMRKLFGWSLVLVIVLGALAVVLLSASVYTYHRLSGETLIAELRFDPSGDRVYEGHLRTGDRCEDRVLTVYGDQWRVDAEFLKWKYWALLLGLDSQYRLDRLEGRYRSVIDQNSQPKLAHDLRDETAVDVVSLAEGLGRWNFLIDASYGSSTYQDIDPANVYYVYRTQTAIITRSKPRPVPEQGEALAVDVDRACGGPLPVWQRLTTWTDERAKEVLAYVQPK
jgi:hypothetical protein